MSDFSWGRLSEHVVREFAAAVVPEATIGSKKKAVEVLANDAGIPTSEFFRDPGVRRVTADVWLDADEAALDRVYSRLLNRGIKPPAGGRAASRRTKLARVRERVRPGGPPMRASVREALTEAILASGGATVSSDKHQELGGFLEVGTEGDSVRLHPYQESVNARLNSMYRARGSRMVGVVVMPTGAGKTVTAVQWLLDSHVRRGRKVLWVTHRRELLEQTARSFIRCAPVLGGQIEAFGMRLIGGGYSPVSTINDSHNDVVIATIGALSSDDQ